MAMHMSLEEAGINVGGLSDDEDSDDEEEEEEVDKVVDHREYETAEQCAKRYTAAKKFGNGKALCLICDSLQLVMALPAM